MGENGLHVVVQYVNKTHLQFNFHIWHKSFLTKKNHKQNTYRLSLFGYKIRQIHIFIREELFLLHSK